MMVLVNIIMDVLIYADNFDSQATMDDGSCILSYRDIQNLTLRKLVYTMQL